MSIKIFFFLVEVMSRDSPEGSMSYLKDFGKQFQHKIIFQERFEIYISAAVAGADSI